MPAWPFTSTYLGQETFFGAFLAVAGDLLHCAPLCDASLSARKIAPPHQGAHYARNPKHAAALAFADTRSHEQCCNLNPPRNVRIQISTDWCGLLTQSVVSEHSKVGLQPNDSTSEALLASCLTYPRQVFFVERET